MPERQAHVSTTLGLEILESGWRVRPPEGGSVHEVAVHIFADAGNAHIAFRGTGHDMLTFAHKIVDAVETQMHNRVEVVDGLEGSR